MTLDRQDPSPQTLSDALEKCTSTLSDLSATRGNVLAHEVLAHEDALEKCASIQCLDIEPGEDGSLLRTVRIDPDAIAMLQHTSSSTDISGSTDISSGVAITDANLIDNQQQMQRSVERDDSSADSCASVSWCPMFQRVFPRLGQNGQRLHGNGILFTSGKGSASAAFGIPYNLQRTQQRLTFYLHVADG